MPIVAGLWCSDSPVFMSLFFSVLSPKCGSSSRKGYSGCSEVSGLPARCMLCVLFRTQWLGRQFRTSSVSMETSVVPGATTQGSTRHTRSGTQFWTRTKNVRTRQRGGMRRAFASGKKRKGVKGPSCLFNLPELNLVEGFVPDYMHCVCLGVVKILMDMRICSKNHAKEYYIGSRSQLAAVNKRITEK